MVDVATVAVATASIPVPLIDSIVEAFPAMPDLPRIKVPNDPQERGEAELAIERAQCEAWDGYVAALQETKLAIALLHLEQQVIRGPDPACNHAHAEFPIPPLLVLAGSARSALNQAYTYDELCRLAQFPNEVRGLGSDMGARKSRWVRSRAAIFGGAIVGPEGETLCS